MRTTGGIETSTQANMAGTLVVAKVKVAIASIVKDDRKLLRKEMGGMHESVKKCERSKICLKGF